MHRKSIFLLGIVLVAVFFRLVGLNWDQNQHLHPDERFLTMVTGVVSWPENFGQYLDPTASPLNPYNTGYNFFVYGTLPMTIVKAASSFFILDNYDYNNITLAGRLVSALCDIGVIWLIWKIGERLYRSSAGWLGALAYSITVLPIQLSHFFAVDTFLVFFMMLTFWGLIQWLGEKKDRLRYPLVIGTSLGLALGCKVTAIFLLPFIGLGWAMRSFSDSGKKARLGKFAELVILVGRKIGELTIMAVFAYGAWRLADPRVFADANWLHFRLSPQFVGNLRQLKSFDDPAAAFPPAVQWITTRLIVFPLRNMILWGFGLPLGLLVVAGVGYAGIRAIPEIRGIRDDNRRDKMRVIGRWLVLGWVVAVFAYQGVQFAKAMRYFYPIYPFLCLLAGDFVDQMIKRYPAKKFVVFYVLFIVLVLVYPISFLSIYLRPHSRVLASEWIYENIPAGSTLSCEHWDDCLPVGLANKNGLVYRYKTEMLELYNQDTPEKWAKINQQLEHIDYLIMSSNRLWGSIPKVPDRYPVTARFYQDLWAGKLSFTKTAEITSYPCFPPIGKPWFCFPDQGADESFTVYDHPMVLIYKKI